MSASEASLNPLADKAALYDALIKYCTGIDSLSDIDGLMSCFTDDAVLDLTGIELPCFKGQAAIRGFFTQVFGDMTHHAHYATNFAVDRLQGDEASCRAYVIGMGVSRNGSSVLVYVRYHLEFVRKPSGWKMKHFSEVPLMPLPKEVAGIHAR